MLDRVSSKPQWSLLAGACRFHIMSVPEQARVLTEDYSVAASLACLVLRLNDSRCKVELATTSVASWNFCIAD